MITNEKLRIYEKFDGDIDGFSRGSNLSDQALITDQDWRLIDELLQSLTIVQSGAASSEFEAKVLERLVDSTPDDRVRDRLRYLAK